MYVCQRSWYSWSCHDVFLKHYPVRSYLWLAMGLECMDGYPAGRCRGVAAQGFITEKYIMSMRYLLKCMSVRGWESRIMPTPSLPEWPDAFIFPPDLNIWITGGFSITYIAKSHEAPWVGLLLTPHIVNDWTRAMNYCGKHWLECMTWLGRFLSKSLFLEAYWWMLTKLKIIEILLIFYCYFELMEDYIQHTNKYVKGCGDCDDCTEIVVGMELLL